jgi:hypothetical protein
MQKELQISVEPKVAANPDALRAAVAKKLKIAVKTLRLNFRDGCVDRSQLQGKPCGNLAAREPSHDHKS